MLRRVLWLRTPTASLQEPSALQSSTTQLLCAAGARQTRHRAPMQSALLSIMYMRTRQVARGNTTL